MGKGCVSACHINCGRCISSSNVQDVFPWGSRPGEQHMRGSFHR